ncbi:MAG: GAF domain-containing protein, partial [Firmicutes bacterium]|nr:GAF domain-containing protein [Bacillota bacterium]
SAVSLVGILGILALLAGTSFAFLITRGVTLPVKNLLGSANAVAGGNLSAKVEATGSDEIAELGRAFNKMVQSLREHQDELLAQNEEIKAQEEELSATLNIVNTERAKLSTFYDFNTSLNKSIELAELCNNIIDSFLKLFEAAACGIVVTDPDDRSIKLVAAPGFIEFYGQSPTPDKLQGLAERAYNEGRSLAISYPETRFKTSVGLNTPCKLAHEVYIPVIFNNKPLGVLIIARLGDKPFTAEDIIILENMIGQGAIAINNALSYLQIHDMYEKILEQAAFVEQLNAQLETERDNLKAAQRIAYAVIESINEAIAMVDLEGRVVAVNKCWENYFGYGKNDLTGGKADELYKVTFGSLQNGEEIRASLKRIISDPLAEGELNITRGNRVLRVWTGPVLDRDENVLGRLFVYRDVTKEIEVDRMKSEFVSTVSHELRTPLASILGFSELLLIKEFNEENRKKYINTIHKEARRLTNLVNDFLDLQRMESGRQEYHMDSIQAKGLIAEVIESFNTRGHPHKILIEGTGDLTVKADRERITQVLLNLLSNAVKFSPGAKEIRAGVERAGNYARFYVKDKGLGIPAEVQANLFAKFYRVDNSDRRKIGGTGLGLAICKEIVDAHGGEIWVDSVHGEGSTFYFTLQLAGAPVKESGTAGIYDRNGKPAVLVVEDDLSL